MNITAKIWRRFWVIIGGFWLAVAVALLVGHLIDPGFL